MSRNIAMGRKHGCVHIRRDVSLKEFCDSLGEAFHIASNPFRLADSAFVRVLEQDQSSCQSIREVLLEADVLGREGCVKSG